MNDNSMAIAILCSHLCMGDQIHPLEPREWGILAQRLMEAKRQPSEVLGWTGQELCRELQLTEPEAERIQRLIDRSGSLGFELSKYENMGIHLVTRADPEYPVRLKKLLGNGCPPLFYIAGNLKLLDREAVGYVGSRTISGEDEAVTRRYVSRTAERGYGVVSGGAKGVDHISEEEVLSLGGWAVGFLADSMLRKIKNSKTVYAIQQGKLLLLSVVNPDAGFNPGIAMMRNRYIYTQSQGTVVIRSDYNKGGTWTGATENLKNNWCPTFCRDHGAYRGNQALIEAGAIPIGDDWDGNVKNIPIRESAPDCQQISMFD